MDRPSPRPASAAREAPGRVAPPRRPPPSPIPRETQPAGMPRGGGRRRRARRARRARSHQHHRQAHDPPSRSGGLTRRDHREQAYRRKHCPGHGTDAHPPMRVAQQSDAGHGLRRGEHGGAGRRRQSERDRWRRDETGERERAVPTQCDGAQRGQGQDEATDEDGPEAKARRGSRRQAPHPAAREHIEHAVTPVARTANACAPSAWPASVCPATTDTSHGEHHSRATAARAASSRPVARRKATAATRAADAAVRPPTGVRAAGSAATPVSTSQRLRGRTSRATTTIHGRVETASSVGGCPSRRRSTAYGDQVARAAPTAVATGPRRRSSTVTPRPASSSDATRMSTCCSPEGTTGSSSAMTRSSGTARGPPLPDRGSER